MVSLYAAYPLGLAKWLEALSADSLCLAEGSTKKTRSNHAADKRRSQGSVAGFIVALSLALLVLQIQTDRTEQIDDAVFGNA